MPIICPTVMAQDDADYAVQMRRIAPFAKRIQIDLMDGDFATPKSVAIDKVWWPTGVIADIHLMYTNPFHYLEQLIHLQPHMVIVHVEAWFHHMHFAAELHKEGILAGLAIMPETPIGNIEQILHSFDHLLIFSGNLGHFGGTADLSLLEKVKLAKEHHPTLEIGWDGGVSSENAHQLATGGVDILNAGGAIQKANDPEMSYNSLTQKLS